MSDARKKSPASNKPETSPGAGRSGVNLLVRALLWLAGLAIAGTAGVALLVTLAMAMAYPNLPDISGLTDYMPKLPLRVLSSDGQLLAEFGEERRNYLPIKEIPKVMQDAVLSIEDARSYQHGGVD